MKITTELNGKMVNIEIATWLVNKNAILICLRAGTETLEDVTFEDYSEKSIKITSTDNGFSCYLPKSHLNITEVSNEVESTENEELKDLRSNRELLIDFLKENKVKGIRANLKTLTLQKKLVENKLEDKFLEETGLTTEYVLFYDEQNQGKKTEYVQFTKVEETVIEEASEVNEASEKTITTELTYKTIIEQVEVNSNVFTTELKKDLLISDLLNGKWINAQHLYFDFESDEERTNYYNDESTKENFHKILKESGYCGCGLYVFNLKTLKMQEIEEVTDLDLKENEILVQGSCWQIQRIIELEPAKMEVKL